MTDEIQTYRNIGAGLWGLFMGLFLPREWLAALFRGRRKAE